MTTLTLTTDELITSMEEKVEHLTLAVTPMERERKDDGYRPSYRM